MKDIIKTKSGHNTDPLAPHHPTRYTRPMSDSGFQFPPGSGSNGGPRDLSQIPGRSDREDSRPERNTQRVRITRVSEGFENIRETTRISAEVVRENRDGSFRVHTPRGDVDIRVAERETPPQPGQRIEIEIRPGSPPREATIRPAPPETTPVEQRHAPPPEIRQSQTPVNVELSPPAQPPRQAGQAEPVQAQEIIRLLPLAANLVGDIVQPVIKLIESIIVQRTDIAAQIILAEAQIPALTNLIRVSAQATVIPEQTSIIALTQSPAQSAPVLRLPLPPILQPVLLSLPAVNFTPPQITREISFAPPQSTVPGAPPAPDILHTLPLEFFTQQVAGGTAPPQLILTTGEQSTIQQPATQALEQQPLQARITGILEPEVQILPPQIGDKAESKPKVIHTKPAILQNNAVSKTAQVVGFIQDSLPVISFALPDMGALPLFVIQIPGSTLPVGTLIQLTPQTGLPVVSAASLPPLAMAVPAAFLTPEPTWPVLEQIYQALTQAAPQAAQALSNMTPQASNPAQLGPAAMFFLAAIRSGDIAGWLGDKTGDILRREGKGNLLSRLSQEGSILNRLSADPISQDWRGISLPHFWQGEIHKMTLYYKEDSGSENDKNQKGRQTRFLFDLNLSQMGKVQLDGLFRTTRLDLIVRSETRFSQVMEMEMKQTYIGALAQTELVGELSFQNRPEQWVKINPEQEVYSSNI